MKRLGPALIIALLLHAAVLGIDPDWFKSRATLPKPKTVTMTLFEVERPVVKKAPRIEQQPPPVSRKKSSKSPITKPKPIARPVPPLKPQKEMVKAPKPKPIKKKISPTLSNKLVEKRRETEPETAVYEPKTYDTPVAVKSVSEPRRENAAIPTEENPVEEPLVEAIPQYAENPKPKYPRIARRRGYGGTVILEALVNVAGRVNNLRIVRSSGHKVLDKAALRAVQTWSFIPGKRGSRPIEMWVRVPVRFELK